MIVRGHLFVSFSALLHWVGNDSSVLRSGLRDTITFFGFMFIFMACMCVPYRSAFVFSESMHVRRVRLLSSNRRVTCSICKQQLPSFRADTKLYGSQYRCACIYHRYCKETCTMVKFVLVDFHPPQP